MVVFDELRISRDSTKLIVSARISNEPKYRDIYITGIKIGSNNTYQEGNIGGVVKTLGTPTKELNMEISNASIALISEINFSKDLIIVEIITSGNIDPNCDCNCSNDKICATMDMGKVYSNFMNMMKQIGSNCESPNDVIDYYLKFKAVETSLESGHYLQGVEYYNKWFKNSKSIVSGGCGCHG